MPRMSIIFRFGDRGSVLDSNAPACQKEYKKESDTQRAMFRKKYYFLSYRRQTDSTLC